MDEMVKNIRWPSLLCCTCMPGLTEDKSGCMIVYTPKPVQFVVRDTSKERITVV